jgi:hypothetical protein
MAINDKKRTGAASTQDSNKPINGTKTEEVTSRLMIRSTDRSPKDRGTLRRAHIAAESVYYPNNSRLIDVFEDALLDGHLFGIIKKRISQVVNKKLVCRDAKGEQRKDLDKLCRSKPLKDIMRQIMWAKMYGINGLEFVPGKNISFNLIPKKHIKRKTQKITFEQTGLDEGIDYSDLSNVWILGEPGDLGLLLVCGYIVMLKKGVVSDWAQYIEIFGTPAIILKYKGYNTQAELAAKKILDNIGNSMRMAVPEEMDIKFEDGKLANGDGKLQETFRQACNEELSVVVLGNTETTGHGKNGTGAKSQTHALQQLELIKDDMDDLVDALNSDHFMNILRSYGYDVEGCEFFFDIETDINFLSDLMDVVKELLDRGLPVPKKWLYDTFGIPMPKDGEEVFIVKKLGAEPADDDAGNNSGTPPKRGKKKQPETPDAEALASAVITRMKAEFGGFFG